MLISGAEYRDLWSDLSLDIPAGIVRNGAEYRDLWSDLSDRIL